MSGGGSAPAPQPTTTTQVQETKMPAWVERESEKNFDFAKQIADKPYQAYTGQVVANPGAHSILAADYLDSTMNRSQDQYDAGAGMMADAGKGILSLNRADYSNPYISDVVNASMSDLDKQRVQALMSNSDAAEKAKAFGGSRHGVVDAITNSETADKAGRLSAELRSAGYDKATGAMQQDITNKLNAGQGMLTAGDSMAKDKQLNFSNMESVGQQEQQQQQAGLDVDQQKFQNEQNYDLQRLNVLLTAMGMSPYGSTTTGTTNGQAFVGGGGGTDWGSLAMGGAMLGAMMFMSDREQKTDIKKLKKDPTTGLDMYAYRYKGDPKSYPKVVGPMAQDVEKRFPGSTKRVGGALAIKGILANG